MPMPVQLVESTSTDTGPRRCSANAVDSARNLADTPSLMTTGFVIFLIPLRYAGIVLRLGHDRFLPSLFQFVIRHPMICAL